MTVNKSRLVFMSYVDFFIYLIIWGAPQRKMTCNRRFISLSTLSKEADYRAITAWVGYESNSLQMNK